MLFLKVAEMPVRGWDEVLAFDFHVWNFHEFEFQYVLKHFNGGFEKKNFSAILKLCRISFTVRTGHKLHKSNNVGYYLASARGH